MVLGKMVALFQLESPLLRVNFHLFQDIFEICGGDRSSGLTWHNLKTAYLGFNGLEKLDTSLVCTP